MGKSITFDKSKAFALRIIRLYKFLKEERNEFILSKQLIRSGTSIGANIAEAEHPQSTADYLSKMNIALKEANETKFWLKLLRKKLGSYGRCIITLRGVGYRFEK